MMVPVCPTYKDGALVVAVTCAVLEKVSETVGCPLDVYWLALVPEIAADRVQVVALDPEIEKEMPEVSVDASVFDAGVKVAPLQEGVIVTELSYGCAFTVKEYVTPVVIGVV